jgi:hypothetical protein
MTKEAKDFDVIVDGRQGEYSVYVDPRARPSEAFCLGRTAPGIAEN